MEITRTENGNTTTLALAGRLDGNTSEQLLAEVRSCDCPNILLQCATLGYVSSAGLRVVLTAHKQCEARGGRLRLAAVGEMLAELLEMTGFDAFIETV